MNDIDKFAAYTVGTLFLNMSCHVCIVAYRDDKCMQIYNFSRHTFSTKRELLAWSAIVDEWKLVRSIDNEQN